MASFTAGEGKFFEIIFKEYNKIIYTASLFLNLWFYIAILVIYIYMPYKKIARKTNKISVNKQTYFAKQKKNIWTTK